MTPPKPASPRNTIFISHAHSDNDLCDQYVTALRARGYDVWYDRSNMEGGQSLSVQIERELGTRSAFVVFLTPASIASYWVRLEIDAYRNLVAKDSSRLFLPVLAAPCEIPPLLRGLKWIDATHLTSAAAVDAIQHALNATPEPLPTTVRRSHPVLRWGLGLGFLTGLCDLGAIILFGIAPANRGTPVVLFFIMLGAVISFLAGLFAARENGMLRAGIGAGFISQLLGLVIFFVASVLVLPNGNHLVMSDYLAGTLIDLAIFGVPAAVGGLLVGWLGGLTGRGAYRRHLRGA